MAAKGLFGGYLCWGGGWEMCGRAWRGGGEGVGGGVRGANPREFTWILEGQKLQNIVIVGVLYSFSWVEITILWNTNSNRNGWPKCCHCWSAWIIGSPRKENTPHANIAVAPIIPAKNAGIKKGKAEHGNELEKFKAAFEMLLPCTRKKSEEEKTKGIQDLE